MAKPKKTKSGAYEIRVRFRNTFTGEWQERRKTFPTAKQCREWENEIRNQVSIGISTDKVKLIDFFDLWFETFKIHTVGLEHQGKIKSTRNSIIQYFDKEILLIDINKLNYQRWINFLGVDKNLAYSTVKDKHSIFKEMMTEAVELDYLVKNPCNRIVLTGRDTSEEKKRTLSMKEWIRLRDVIANSPIDCASKWVCLTMMYTGLRFQEATGLQSTDVDLSKKIIYITKAYDYKIAKDRNKTKTPASVREVDMVDELVEILMPIVKRAKPESKVVSLTQKENSYYLFTDKETELPITNAAINKYIAKKCKEADVDRITSHAFRHAQTDLLALSENDIVYTQKQLGHKDPQTTLKYYRSVTPEIREKNKNQRNEFLKDSVRKYGN